jgi:hypothetical protein
VRQTAEPVHDEEHDLGVGFLGDLAREVKVHAVQIMGYRPSQTLYSQHGPETNADRRHRRRHCRTHRRLHPPKRGFEVQVFERESTPGGRMRSEQHGDFVIERGAQFIASSYRNMRALAAELGIAGLIEPLGDTRNAVLPAVSSC